MSDLRVHSVHVAAAGEGRAVTQSVTIGADEDVQAFTTRVLAMLEAMGLPFSVDAAELAAPAPAPTLVAPPLVAAPAVPTPGRAARGNKRPKTERARQIVARLRERTATIAQIAIEFGITETNVRQLRRRWCPDVSAPASADASPVATASAAPEPPARSPHPPEAIVPAAAVTRSRLTRAGGGIDAAAKVCRDDRCSNVALHYAGSGECARRGAST